MLDKNKILPLNYIGHSIMKDDIELDKRLCDVINGITALAVLNANILHIDIQYAAWLQSFSVKVFEVGTNYMRPHTYLFVRQVQLERPDVLNELKNLEDLLIDKIADAKDKLMGVV